MRNSFHVQHCLVSQVLYSDGVNSIGLRPRQRSARFERPLHSTKQNKMARSDLRRGLNKGHPTTPIPKVVKPSQRKGIQSNKTLFVRSIIREVAGVAPYERRVMELIRNSKDKRARKLTKKRLGTMRRMKIKMEELSGIIAEQRRAGHH